MPDPDKRLAMLREMTQSGKADAFAWYGLALELKKRGEHDEALEAFERLREQHPSYVPQYLMCGTMLAELGRPEKARDWLERGIAVAREKGESHAVGELEDALAQLD